MTVLVTVIEHVYHELIASGVGCTELCSSKPVKNAPDLKMFSFYIHALSICFKWHLLLPKKLLLVATSLFWSISIMCHREPQSSGGIIQKGR
jgi:hypothetical protein